VGLTRCGTVFPVSAVVGAAVPATVCRWGLFPCCPGVGRCLSGVYNHHLLANEDRGRAVRCVALARLRALSVDPQILTLYGNLPTGINIQSPTCITLASAALSPPVLTSRPPTCMCAPQVPPPREHAMALPLPVFVQG